MKAIGIVKRMDDLGRVVIPKEIRRALRINPGNPLEIFAGDDGEIILKKYARLEDCQYLTSYAYTLSDNTGMDVAICSSKTVVAACGDTLEEFYGESISTDLLDMMQDREAQSYAGSIVESQDEDNPQQIVVPMYSRGDILGCVVAVRQDGEEISDTAQSYVEMVATLIEKLEDWEV